MVSSLDFGSNDAYFNFRPIQTRFPYAYTSEMLKLACNINSLAHSSIGTTSPKFRLCQLVSIRFQVLFHSPNRGTFHLSLTVLVHYRCLYVFSLNKWSCYLHTGFHVSHATLEQPKKGIYVSNTGLLPSMVRLSSRLLLRKYFVTFPSLFQLEWVVRTPM